MTFYVYTYVIDGVPRYVGKGVGGRWAAHRKADTRLGRTLRKRQQEAIEWIKPTIEHCESNEAAFLEEQRLIKLYGREDLGQGTLWNHTDGGEGSPGYRHSEEFKQRMAKRVGSNNPFFGRNHTAEAREVFRKTHLGNTYMKGRKLSESHRRNIGLGISGDRNPACKVKTTEYPKLLQLKQQGLTQKQIGEVVGLTQSQVSKILRSLK